MSKKTDGLTPRIANRSRDGCLRARKSAVSSFGKTAERGSSSSFGLPQHLSEERDSGSFGQRREGAKSNASKSAGMYSASYGEEYQMFRTVDPTSG
ncbi:hypothetical protein UVI_02007530 [Ustilaginoidea virens]|uniref:Uncharacterized protein n=1 Tax=Ustilaginoidea virens TaxID=1159556 RepID=A0A1B5KVC0_USTVR|nr:hypothetical protein UVI_02007530 [Ustilaginoidea virens]